MRPFFLGLAGKAPDFPTVHEELARPFGLVVVVGRARIRADVEIVKPDFAALDPGVTVLEVCPAFPKGFHFGARKDHPGFQGLKDFVIVEGLFVLADDFDAVLDGGRCFLHRVSLVPQSPLR